MKEEEKLEKVFESLRGSFDIEEPTEGHELRFLEKLNENKGVVSLERTKKSWWKPLSIAASIVLLCVLGLGVFQQRPTVEEQLAEIAPEVSQTQFYFASLIEEQVRDLESKSTPQTKRLIDDTLIQLNKLEADYSKLEQDLLQGGNSKLILSAMITNFQTRIELLTEVMTNIENIENIKANNDENFTI